jgi:hypothetical protein
MNRTAFFIVCSALMITLTGYLSSCKTRDETNPPGVGFVSEAGYVSDDTTLPANSVATIWVYANKLGVVDLLDSATIQTSVNGGPDSILQTMRFNSTQFSQYYSYQLGAAGNSYKYIFTFFNQNKVGGSDSLTITTY